MELTTTEVHLTEVAGSRTQRADERFHRIHSVIGEAIQFVSQGSNLGVPTSAIRNGANLSAKLYADPESTPEAWYVSVSGLSQAVLRIDECKGLNRVPSPSDAPPLARNEVLVTRSGTPGIAWTPESEDEIDRIIIPSGFVIRATINPEVALPTYVAAILNHPLWRAYLLAVSAGKSQDNIGQDDLLSTPIPLPPKPVQEKVASQYRTALGEIRQALLDGSNRLASACDAILAEHLGLLTSESTPPRVRSASVMLSSVASSRVQRIDARYHSKRHFRTIQAIKDIGAVPLASLLDAPIKKGQQPTFVDTDAPDAIAIAVSSIQEGQVHVELTKPTTLASAKTFPVPNGSLVIAMDGDGALGKAAVVPDYGVPFTCDSHVAVTGSSTPGLSQALACFLNSSFGSIQTNSLMSGSTGQTQLAPDDLAGIYVPREISSNAPQIAASYSDLLREYLPTSQRVRRILSGAGSQTMEILQASGAISSPPDSTIADLLFDLKTLEEVISWGR